MPIIKWGDKVKNSEELLTSVLHTVQMGQIGIRAVNDSAVKSGLRQELDRQLKEYDRIEKDALQLAQIRGWELGNVNPIVRQMSKIMSQVRLLGGDVDSKIAGMLIQGNTRGVILGVKNLNRYDKKDDQISYLAQELLNKENINIQKTQPYL